MTPRRQSEARTEIVSVASKMLNGDIALVEGARMLCDLRHKIGTSDSDLFSAIVGFESETDNHPVGVQRRGWSQESLAAMDQEMARYLSEVRPTVLRACRRLIAAFRA